MNNRQRKIQEVRSRWQTDLSGGLVPYSALSEGKDDVIWLLEENEKMYDALQAIGIWIVEGKLSGAKISDVEAANICAAACCN